MLAVDVHQLQLEVRDAVFACGGRRARGKGVVSDRRESEGETQGGREGGREGRGKGRDGREGGREGGNCFSKCGYVGVRRQIVATYIPGIYEGNDIRVRRQTKRHEGNAGGTLAPWVRINHLELEQKQNASAVPFPHTANNFVHKFQVSGPPKRTDMYIEQCYYIADMHERIGRHPSTANHMEDVMLQAPHFRMAPFCRSLSGVPREDAHV